MSVSYNNKYVYSIPSNNEEFEEYYKVMKPWKNTIE